MNVRGQSIEQEPVHMEKTIGIEDVEETWLSAQVFCHVLFTVLNI